MPVAEAYKCSPEQKRRTTIVLGCRTPYKEQHNLKQCELRLLGDEIQEIQFQWNQ